MCLDDIRVCSSQFYYNRPGANPYYPSYGSGVINAYSGGLYPYGSGGIPPYTGALGSSLGSGTLGGIGGGAAGLVPSYSSYGSYGAYSGYGGYGSYSGYGGYGGYPYGTGYADYGK